MKIIKVPACTIDRDRRVYKSGRCGGPPVPIRPAKQIILPQDIPAASRYGPKQVRPDGARDPRAESRVIAKIVMAVNGMSTFAG